MRRNNTYMPMHEAHAASLTAKVNNDAANDAAFHFDCFTAPLRSFSPTPAVNLSSSSAHPSTLQVVTLQIRITVLWDVIESPVRVFGYPQCRQVGTFPDNEDGVLGDFEVCTESNVITAGSAVFAQVCRLAALNVSTPPGCQWLPYYRQNVMTPYC